MRAIVVAEGETAPSVVEKPRPVPDAGEALVRTLRVGVDGTDFEVLNGSHGGFPPGEDHLVLGHEAVGVVADANGTDLREGQVVAPTVRREPPGEDPNPYFERGEPDMAPEGRYHERGIEGAHGFMAEYFTSPAEYLVSVPRELADVGFLVEPLSVIEKTLEHAYASRTAFEWDPESAIVLGNGSLGLLALARLADDVDRRYCLGRRDRPDPTIDVIEELSATYVDSRETPVDSLAEAHEGMDVVVEATGYPPHALESVHALAPNGVAALLGVPDSWEMTVDAGAYHREMVMHNKAVVGTVNSHVRHFEAGVDTLARLPQWLLDDLVTGVHPVEDFERAFVDDDTTIKTAVQFSAYEER